MRKQSDVIRFKREWARFLLGLGLRPRSYPTIGRVHYFKTIKRSR